MKTPLTRITLSVLLAGLFLFSCTKDESQLTEESQLKAVSSKATLKTLPPGSANPNRLIVDRSGISAEDFKIGSSLINVVNPSECGPTPFRGVLTKYNDLLIDDFFSIWDGNFDAYFLVLDDYFIINQIAARFENKNTDYFGANGEYTAYVNNRVRSLEKFWDMPDLIEVNGQHTATLEDLDFIRHVYENYTGDPALPDYIIDYLVGLAAEYNAASAQIPENPFYASDGFATFDRKIVIGDGIVSMLSEVGIDPKVVWSSILAHEWGHQIQFLNYGIFEYPIPPFNGMPESTRMTELEADYLTGYYLTHKRGGTYNWKRVEAVLQSFFEIGDCGFGSGGHHGTPLQRMEAAKKGFDLANDAQKKGKILSQQAVHDAFIAALDGIVGGGVIASSSNGNVQ